MTRFIVCSVIAATSWAVANSFVVVTTPPHNCQPYNGNANAVPKKQTSTEALFATAPTKTKEDDSTVDTKPINPRTMGLALLLDEGTRKSHSMAQNSAFVTGFFKGLSTIDSYQQLVTSLYHVYQEMETALDSTTDKRVQKLDDPALRRVDSLQRDMDYFYGCDTTENGKGLAPPTAATQIYMDRIRQVAQNDPTLLIAHQYTRYLGDLFGGQMMGGMATKSLDLEDGQGVAFYAFDDIPDTTAFITEWYQKLNDLDLTEAQKQEIVDEANYVFDLNIGILQELDGSPWRAVLTLGWNSLRQRLGLTPSQ